MAGVAELKRIDPMSVGKIIAVVYFILFFIEGIFTAFEMASGTFSPELSILGEDLLSRMGYLIIIVAPLLGAVFGFITGFILAALYNFAASKLGGVKLEFD